LKAQEITLDSNYVNQIIYEAQIQSDPIELFDKMETALLVARSINYAEGKAKLTDWFSKYYENKGEHVSALRYYLELLEVHLKEKNMLAAANTKFRIGEIYAQEGLHEKAIEYYRDINNPQANKIEIWQRMINCFRNENKLDSAAYYIDKVYNVAKQKDDLDLLLNTMQEQVLSSTQEGTYRKALKYNLEILALIKEKGNLPLMARGYNNLGYNYDKLQDYETALNYYKMAEAIDQNVANLDLSKLYTNMGITYQNQGDLSQSIVHLKLAREIVDRKKQPIRFSYISHLISVIYYKNGDLYNALNYNEDAIYISKLNDDYIGLKDIYELASSIHQGLFDYEKALNYYKNHLALKDSFLLEERMSQQSMLQQQYLMERAEKEIKILLSNQKIQDLNMNQLNLEKEKLELFTSTLRLEAEKKDRELTLLKQEQEIRETVLKNKELQSKQTQQDLLLTTQQLKAAKQQKKISDLNRLEAEQRLALAERANIEKERLKEIDMLSKDKEILTRQQEIAALEIEKQSTFRKLAKGFGALGLIILCLILAGLVFARRSNTKLSLQNIEIENQKSELEENRDIIQSEKAKSDALLLNILPAETARELREVGSATPKKYDLVSVLFTDFSDFTSISKSMSAEELIEELNECFIAFDEIVNKYGLEKIKTIGDSYMCAGGLPKPNKTNPTDVVLAAIEMNKFMNKRHAQKQRSNKEYWNMRIGIHSGEVIAGVVGKNKFAYDIWGDTVNLASRMESNGEIGKINISAATHAYVKDNFKFTPRGSLPIKNGGEVEMYFVER